MFLWIFFIVVSFFLGLAISYLLDCNFHGIERAFFSFVVGHAISIWIIFLLACLKGSLSVDAILICAVICALTSVILAATKQKPSLENLRNKIIDIWYTDKYILFFFAFILIYLLFMNLYGVLRPDEAGNLYAIHTVWADYPFHTSVITSFVYSDNFTFPLSYPQFLDTELHYPFIMDFYSAVLIKAGLGLRSSIIVPNIMFQLTFFGLFYYLAYRLTGLKKVGILAVIIFIFSGFPKAKALENIGIYFLNPMYAVIMPQRTAMLGMGISFAVYILLYNALFKKKDESGGDNKPASIYKELFLAGTLIGLLPYIHAHSFMVTAFVSLVLCSFVVIQKASQKKLRIGRGCKIFFFLFAPLILLSLAQVLCISSRVSEDFFVFFPGWAEENRNMILGFGWSFPESFFSSLKTVFVLTKFWMLNMGILFFLLLLGFLKSERSVKVFYLPFLFLFGIANFVKFQPWYFDNYKIFLHWHALTIILAVVAIFWIADSVRSRSNSKKIGAFALASLIILCSFCGAVTHVGMFWSGEEIKIGEVSILSSGISQVWSGEEIKIAEWVRENTAPDSIFLTGTGHNHPIPSLSGRPRVVGYEGWLWSHGINWSSISELKKGEIEIYKGNYTIINDFGVDYVCVGPYERAFATDNHFEINYSAFDDETRFYLRYDKEIRGEQWMIYEVKTPTSQTC